MCGIAGFLDLSARLADDSLCRIAGRMAGTLHHRGPDDAGTWADETAGIAFGHQRLAIVDLSSHGHQPMRSANDRFVIVFNGEIYNFAALGRDLEQHGHRFRGHSDTEVMLEAISEWGLTHALTRCNGMFAFALWDRRDRVLTLVRDRLGEKPVYYGWAGSTFLFASELKALSAHPAFEGEIDRDVLALYFRRNFVPSPFSIYQRVYKLPPACVLAIPTSPANARDGFSPFPDEDVATFKPIRYWSLAQAAERGAGNPFEGSANQAVDALDGRLSDAVRLRMTADVPIGAFLSGGIDSSTIVAMMQAASTRPIQTFSIGSEDRAYDEADAASAVARHLGTNHVNLCASWRDAMRVIPTLPTLYDEPFADSSQIPTALVAQLARRDVTVCVSGDGGDELFAGYNLYFWAERIWQKTRLMPAMLRQTAARALTAVPPQMWDGAFASLSPIMPSAWRQREAGDKIFRLADLLPADSQTALYNTLMSRWRDPAALVMSSHEPEMVVTHGSEPGLHSFVHRMMYFDQMTYLPDDILAKVDRASMGVGLEVRIPLLDPSIVEFAWRLPLSMVVRGGRGKWLLRQVLNRYVPAHLVDRPKTGFSIPLSEWLRGPLREWADGLLGQKRLRDDGYLNPQLVRRKWSEHVGGRRNWSRELWEVLMFQAWLDHARGSHAGA